MHIVAKTENMLSKNGVAIICERPKHIEEKKVWLSVPIILVHALSRKYTFDL